MSKVLGQDTSTGLLLLGDLIGVALGVLGEVGAVVLGATSGTGNRNVVWSQLSVVEQKSCLGSSLLLENDGSRLGFTLSGDFEISDLATEYARRSG